MAAGRNRPAVSGVYQSGALPRLPEIGISCPLEEEFVIHHLSPRRKRWGPAVMAAVAAIPGLESVYFITHDVDLALTHADRILVLRDGRIVADGPPATVVEDAERWHASNLHRTSLIAANLAWPAARGHRFLDAPTLAAAMIAGAHVHGAGEGGSSVTS